MYVRKTYNYKNNIPKHLVQSKSRKVKLPLNRKTSRWTLRTFLAIVALLAMILIVPTVIVIPFTNKGDPLQAVTEQKQSIEAEAPSITVSVKRSKNKNTENVDLETYVARVVASEMPTDFELEALKAQGLAARTYIINHMLNQENTSISDVETDQVYKDEDELRKLWGENFYTNMEKLREAVLATEGQIITYEGKPITAAYFSTSNGFTENSEDYWEHELPYLRSVSSPWDEDSPRFKEQFIFPITEIEAKLDIKVTKDTSFKITRTKSGRVSEVIIANNSFTGREIRESLSLPSSDFSIKKNAEHIIFTTKGFGHGIGMSQYGANGMAKEGKTYDEIIHYYYKDVKIKKITDIDTAFLNKQ